MKKNEHNVINVNWERIYDLLERYKDPGLNKDEYRELTKEIPKNLPENEGCYVVFRIADKERRYVDATSVDFKDSFSDAVEIINMILAKHHIKHDAPYDPNVDWKLILCELADFAAMAYRTYHLFGSDYDLQNEGGCLSELRSRCQRHLEVNC